MEVSTAELRKHGILLRDGQPNEFHKLVQGFANNIRILAKGPKDQSRLPWERDEDESSRLRRASFCRRMESLGNWCFYHGTVMNLCYDPRFCKTHP